MKQSSWFTHQTRINPIQHHTLIFASWWIRDLTAMTGLPIIKMMNVCGSGHSHSTAVLSRDAVASPGQRQPYTLEEGTSQWHLLRKGDLSLRLMKIRVTSGTHSSWLIVSWSKTLMITQIPPLWCPKPGWLSRCPHSWLMSLNLGNSFS